MGGGVGGQRSEDGKPDRFNMLDIIAKMCYNDSIVVIAYTMKGEMK